jgi:hypothetical protein
MKIEALEGIKSAGYVLIAGDSITVPDEIGTLWVKAGWAKDVAGTVETGERVVLNAKLAVDAVKMVVTNTNVGVQ